MRRYRCAVWNEPVIFEMGQHGQRGYIPPPAEDEVKAVVGDVGSRIPPKMRRKQAPALPELSEPETLTHYLHLSQENFGFDSGICVGVGTCTMKYSPKVNEELCRMPQFADIHPLQDESTVQGILEVMYTLSSWLEEITGMDQVCVDRFSLSAVVNPSPAGMRISRTMRSGFSLCAMKIP